MFSHNSRSFDEMFSSALNPIAATLFIDVLVALLVAMNILSADKLLSVTSNSINTVSEIFVETG